MTDGDDIPSVLHCLGRLTTSSILSGAGVALFDFACISPFPVVALPELYWGERLSFHGPRVPN